MASLCATLLVLLTVPSSQIRIPNASTEMAVTKSILVLLALAWTGLVSGEPSDSYAAAMPSYEQPKTYAEPAYVEPSYDVSDVVRTFLPSVPPAQRASTLVIAISWVKKNDEIEPKDHSSDEIVTDLGI